MNVVLISVDSLRKDHVGNSGENIEISTPALDSLVVDSIGFENAFSNAPYTRASFPSILTGTYAWMYGGMEFMSENRPRIASSFENAGFATAGFHSNPYLKAEFGYDDGFDQYYEGESSRTRLAKVREYVVNNLSDDSSLYRMLRRIYSAFEESTGVEVGTPYEPAETITDRAIDWLTTNKNPSFLWIHYMDPHHPWTPRTGTVSEKIDPRQAVRLRQRMLESSDSLTEDEIEIIRRLYAGEIEYLDRSIDELITVVDQRMNEETVIVFMADHGEAFGEHGYFGHPPSLHDELIHIPLYVRLPDQIGETVHTPVSAVDVMPTLLAAADLPVPDSCEGQSLLSIADDSPDDRVVFSHSGVWESGSVMACDGQQKLVRNLEDNSKKVYDRTADIEQKLINEPNPDLRIALENHLDRIEQKRGETRSTAISSDTEEQLRQLGYK